MKNEGVSEAGKRAHTKLSCTLLNKKVNEFLWLTGHVYIRLAGKGTYFLKIGYHKKFTFFGQ